MVTAIYVLSRDFAILSVILMAFWSSKVNVISSEVPSVIDTKSAPVSWCIVSYWSVQSNSRNFADGSDTGGVGGEGACEVALTLQ